MASLKALHRFTLLFICAFLVSACTSELEKISLSWQPPENEQGPIVIESGGWSLNEDDQVLYITDTFQNAIIEIDLATGKRKKLSGVEIGSGFELEDPYDVVYHSNLKKIFVTSSDPHSYLVEVDPITGDRITRVASVFEIPGKNTSSQGSNIQRLNLIEKNLMGLYIYSDKFILINLDSNLAKLHSGQYQPDTHSLDEKILARGKLFEDLREFYYDSSIRKIVSIDEDLESLVLIDRDSGDRDFLEGPDANNRPGLKLVTPEMIFRPNSFESLAYDKHTKTFYILKNDIGEFGLFSFNLNDNAIIPLKKRKPPLFAAKEQKIAGDSVQFIEPKRILFNHKTKKLLLWDEHPGNLWSIDIKSGKRKLLSSSRIGHGRSATSLNYGKYNLNDQSFYTYAGDSPNESCLLRIDLEEKRGQCVDEGPQVDTSNFAFDASGTGYWQIDSHNHKLIYKKLKNPRVIESEHPLPQEINKYIFQNTRVFEFSKEINKLFMANENHMFNDGGFPAIYSFDLDSKKISTLSSKENGTGPIFTALYGLHVSKELDALYSFDRETDKLFKINLDSGNREESLSFDDLDLNDSIVIGKSKTGELSQIQQLYVKLLGYIGYSTVGARSSTKSEGVEIYVQKPTNNISPVTPVQIGHFNDHTELIVDSHLNIFLSDRSFSKIEQANISWPKQQNNQSKLISSYYDEDAQKLFILTDYRGIIYEYDFKSKKVRIAYR